MKEDNTYIIRGYGKFKILKISILVVAATYLLLCTVAFFLQDKIIFSRQKLSHEFIEASATANNVENVELQMKDGTIIRGWMIKNTKTVKSPLLIYFGANAEEVSNLIPKMSTFQNWSIALINYRGYGASEGTPGERELYDDSVEVYDYFANRDDIDKSNIAIMGRSIGTGVATYLASERSIQSVILVSPYETLTSVAKEKLPFLPVDLLLKYKFNSISRAPSIHSSLLIVVGDEDKLIPIWHSKKLADAWAGTVKFEEIEGAGHNTVDDSDVYWNAIYTYLNRKSS